MTGNTDSNGNTAESYFYELTHTVTFKEMCAIVGRFNESIKKNGSSKEGTITIAIDLEEHGLTRTDTLQHIRHRRY